MKKILVILITLFVGCAMFAQESSDSAKKERIPMYVGASLGFDNWQSVDYKGDTPIRISSFAFDIAYGIRPFRKLPASALEFGIKLNTKGSGKSGSVKREASVAEITAKYIYDFKSFNKLPKLNVFVFGGVTFSNESYTEEGRNYTDWSTVTGFTLPIGAGLKYSINEKFEATAKAEFGIGSLLNFGMTAGMNFKF